MGGGFGRLGTSGGGVTAASGGAALLIGETDGFATDFLHATDAQRVAVKVASATTNSALDAFFSNTGTSPKQVFNAVGTLVWSPHNMYIQSATPASRSVTTVVGQDYTVTVTGTGSLTGSAGASGVATAGAPLTYTATTTTSTFTLAGSLTTVQMNRGAVATAYLATTASARNGLAVDYDPATLVARGLLCEPAATNLLLNNTTLSTQSVTVTAVAHTLSFYGTGTVTLTGTSTAGPLVGTGAGRVSLTFTPTAGSLTLTVSGTVSNAQLETGSVATSPIKTFAASATRALDAYSCTSASINYSATAGSWRVENYMVGSGGGRVLGASGGAVGFVWHNGVNGYQLNDGTAVTKTLVTALVGVVHKTASAFQSGDRAITVDGLAAATDAGSTALLLAPGTNILFGAGVSGAGAITGYIRKITYRPRRVSNADLATETA